MPETEKKPCSHTPCTKKSKKQNTKNKKKPIKQDEEDKALTSYQKQPTVSQEVSNNSDDQDPNEVLIGKPLLFTGVVAVGVIKKILLPSACLGAAAVSQSSQESGEKKSEKVRPRDLPIYAEAPAKKQCEPKPGDVDSTITSAVRQIREGTWAVLDQAKVFTNQACDFIDTGKAHTSSTITYLREEENAIPRYGAIGLGGLAGLVLSLRRGIFKRLLYTTTGAVGMAAVLYPQEAREYSAEGLKMAKKYIIVGYHFINGDEPTNEKGKRARRRALENNGKTTKKHITSSNDKNSSEPDCLCPDKDNKCPEDPVPPGN